MTFELCVAVQSCVYREYRSGLRTQPCGAPVLRIRGDDVLLPILTTWLLPVRKSRIQLHRDLFSPRVWSFATSVAGTMVLNAEMLFIVINKPQILVSNNYILAWNTCVQCRQVLAVAAQHIYSTKVNVVFSKTYYFHNKINNAPDMRNLFITFNSLLCPHSPPPTTSITADDFATFFYKQNNQ